MQLLTAPISGTVWKVLTAPGQAFAAGEDLVIMESMKMEIPVSAPAAGTIREVRVDEGDFVQEGDVLLSYE